MPALLEGRADGWLAGRDEAGHEGAEKHVGLELQLVGARNVKAARALLPNHDNDIEKLRTAESWLFSASPALAGATRLPSTGAAGADESRK